MGCSYHIPIGMQGQCGRSGGRRCRDYLNQSINQTSQNQTPERRGSLDPGDTNLLFIEGSSVFPASLLPPSFPGGSLETHLSLFQHTLPTFQSHLFFHCLEPDQIPPLASCLTANSSTACLCCIFFESCTEDPEMFPTLSLEG